MNTNRKHMCNSPNHKKRSIFSHLMERNLFINEESTEKKVKLSDDSKYKNYLNNFPVEKELTNTENKANHQLMNYTSLSQSSNEKCLPIINFKNEVICFKIQENGGYNDSHLIKNMRDFSLNYYNFSQMNSTQIHKNHTNIRLPVLQFCQKKLIPYFYQTDAIHLQKEIMLISNYIIDEWNNPQIEALDKNLVPLKTYPRLFIYDQIQRNNQVNSLLKIIETTSKHNLSCNMNSNRFILIPSCTKCVLPGFHSNTAWLLPPSFFGRGGRLKRKTGFLRGLPIRLFGTCFSIKNILTVESTNLFVTTARKEEYEYINKGIITLKEEDYEESIYYLEDDINNDIISSGSKEESIKSLFDNNSYCEYECKSAQNAVFCGFVAVDSIFRENAPNISINNDIIDNQTNSNIENYSINSRNQSNRITITYICDDKFPNKISDCDILLRKITHINALKDKNVRNSDDQKVFLLIPRLKCVVRQSKFKDIIFTINKPCYLLLWNYNIRNCNNTIKDINWINIQCRFVPLKYFGNAFEKSVSINIKPHQELILDQLNRIRNIEEARIFAWILAGCMQFTINELLLDSFTRSLFLGNKIIDIQNIPTFNKSISNGPFLDFPESPLDQNGKIKWEVLKEILENDLHI